MRLKLFIAGICGAALAHSQTWTAARPILSEAAHPLATRPSVEAAPPSLGYVSNGSMALKPVAGSIAKPVWGEPISLPISTSQAFLPPGQEYALLASSSGLSVARLSRSTLYPGVLVAGAMAQPDQVGFSPSGSAAVLISHTESRMQTLQYRSGIASVVRSLAFSNGTLTNFTISDDGELVVAAFDNQPRYSLKGSAWQPMGTIYAPGAWTFLPRSHDLVLSDLSEKAIVLWQGAEGASPVTRLLVPDAGPANLLAVNKRGTRVVGAIDGSKDLWVVDLIAGKDLVDGRARYISASAVIHSLTYLRDGETILIATQGSPAVVSLGTDARTAPADAVVR